jgi:transcriptional regulator with XRE-family HTH domain
MASIQERLNDIRQAKHVPIAVFEKNGISKTKYFAFLRGERDLSLADLHVILDLLSISFSELLKHTNEFDDWTITDVLTTRYDTPENVAKKLAKAERDFEVDGLTGNQQLVWMYQTIYEIQSGGDVKPPIANIYKALKRYKYFNYFEMRLLAITAPYLTPKKFFNLYKIYTAGVYAFRYFIPEEMLKIMRNVNGSALSFLMNHSVKSAAQIKFVLDALISQPRRNVNAELHLHHQFAAILKMALFEDYEQAAEMFQVFQAAAERQGINIIKLEDNLDIDFRKAWDKITNKRHSMVDDLSETDASAFNKLDFRLLVPEYGTEIKRVLDAKRITVRELERHGFSRTRMYRLFNNQGSVYVSELLKFMRLGRIEPGDIDAMLSFHTGSRTEGPLRRQFEANPDLTDRIAAAYESYQKTGVRRQLEYALLYKTLHNQRTVPMWPLSHEAVDTANEISEMLFGIEEWDEQEHRLVEYSLMNVASAEEAVQRLRTAERQMKNRDVYHTITNSVLKNSESVLFKFLLAKDRHGFEMVMDLVAESVKRDAHILDFAVWRWRWELYQTYAGLFDRPDEALDALCRKFQDYVVLTGNQFILDNYNNALRDLVSVFAEDFTWQR